MNYFVGEYKRNAHWYPVLLLETAKCSREFIHDAVPFVKNTIDELKYISVPRNLCIPTDIDDIRVRKIKESELKQTQLEIKKHVMTFPSLFN